MKKSAAQLFEKFIIYFILKALFTCYFFLYLNEIFLILLYIKLK